MITEQHRDFLNDLRDSGVTNMFGAAPYLQKEFGIDQKSAREVLANWMQSFSENLEYKGRKFSAEEEDRLDLISHKEFDGKDFSKLSDEDKAKVFAQRDKVGVKEAIKETLNLSWTLVGLVIATLTLTGSAQQITGLATIITLCIWLLTIGFRKGE